MNLATHALSWQNVVVSCHPSVLMLCVPECQHVQRELSDQSVSVYNMNLATLALSWQNVVVICHPVSVLMLCVPECQRVQRELSDTCTQLAECRSQLSSCQCADVVCDRVSACTT